MTDSETIALRKTVIGGKAYADDFTVIWRDLPIGRMMRASGLSSRSGDHCLARLQLAEDWHLDSDSSLESLCIFRVAHTSYKLARIAEHHRLAF
jgi:hypothetical protein